MFGGWCFTINSSFQDSGRIIVAWKPGVFIVSIIGGSSQALHCLVEPISGFPSFFCTFIYAFNDNISKRMEIWQELKRYNTDRPAWVIGGYLNCVISVKERLGCHVRSSEIEHIKLCIHECNMSDLHYTCNFFTWNNKQQDSSRVYSKIDRIMVNPSWMDSYSTAEASFLNEGIFDYYLGLLTVYPRQEDGKNPFKYFTMWRRVVNLSSRVSNARHKYIHGSKMFVVVQKLKQVKSELKDWDKTSFQDVQILEIQAFQKM